MNSKTSQKGDSKNNITPYNSLSPVEDVDKHKEYCDALEWAFIHRKEKDIKNIALTGNYGSGKSSILKTFIAREIEGLNFLKISLATFKDEKHNQSNIPSTIKEIDNTQRTLDTDKLNKKNESNTQNKQYEKERNDQLRLIELSILQQIFYHEKNDKIPHSRFKKIRSLKPKEVLNATWLIFGVICTFYLFFNFNTFLEISNLPDPKNWFEYITKGLLLSGFLILFFFLLKKVILFSQRLTISKLNFQNLEIQIAETINKSILNDHLDEILYFFEATDYNMVIIEDLDRFEQTEIFTKLREINLLINNSKSINRHVLFIYAVRDEMFKEGDRTKFFDFIIPVIPVINYSNSNEQLKKSLKEFGYNVTSALLDEVSFFVNDMRLLFNIVNEFHIYFQKFKGNKYIDKLFAIIVYKNIYPDDFVKLGLNKGQLYKYLVENKIAWVNEAKNKLKQDNIDLNNELNDLEKVLPRNLEELKKIYLFECIKRLKNFNSFYINNTNYSIDKILEDENFENLLNNNVRYNSIHYTNQPLGFQFSVIEDEINPEQSYQARKAQIKNDISTRKASIRQKINSNQDKIKEFSSTKIKDLLKDKNISVSSNPTRQEQLILMLIRNGYIAEDYLNYISYFYPGSITENDHWFLMNVKNEAPSNNEYKLDKIQNVIKRISDSDFTKPYIFNFNLLDNLINDSRFFNKKESLLKQLANESEDSFSFIQSYIQNGKYVEILIKELSSKWANFWGYVELKSSLSEEEKLKFYSLILNNASENDIDKLSKNTGMELFISNKPDFLTFINKESKLISILDLFDIKFSDISFDGVSNKIQLHVYRAKNYKLVKPMIELMLKTFGSYDEELFNSKNYECIQTSKCDELIKYVDEYINTYLKLVYLKIESNKYEDEDYLIKLVNNADITSDNKENLIKHSNTQISNISKLTHESFILFASILENNRLVPNWENIAFIFKENQNQFSEPLMYYINQADVSATLSSQSFLSKEKNHPIFRRAFLLNNDILDERYDKYVNSFPFTYNDLDFEKLNRAKVKALVEHKKLQFNATIYSKLKTEYTSLHINLLINNVSKFIKEFDKIDLSEKDLIEILSSPKVDTSSKIKIIHLFQDNHPITEVEALTLIGSLKLIHTALNLKESILNTILLESSLNSQQKIELLLNNKSIKKDEFLSNFLNSLGGDFKSLNSKGPMPSFDKTEVLKRFFQELKEVGKISKVKEKDDSIKVTTFRI
ncbi:MAG: hypothetical protein CL868_08540 [Cytophagaceae bacterium]|nr:hypothetical protein [Cytophagaceae bacterium]|tara:strand:+ start:1269 stop:4952 length:3684 start_codon:yes stop_codon:yes gene_type:complete